VSNVDGGAGPGAAPTCYRHPDREAYVRCTRCNRPVCPDCRIDAAVGFQCRECVQGAAKGQRRGRTPFGGRASGDPAYVTKLLLGFLVVGYLAQQGSAKVAATLQLVGIASDPDLGGALVGVAAGQWYRLFTVTLLHASVLHIALNGYALWLFGPPVEAAFGRLRFGVLWVLSALGGSAASFAFSAPTQPAVGASGAIFGLLAALFVVGRQLRMDLSGLVILVILNAIIGVVSPGIDWRAHAGGFLTGAVVGIVMAHAPRRRRAVVQVAGCIAVLTVIMAVVTLRTSHLIHVPGTAVLRCEVSAAADPNQTFVQCVTS
jgi:membrane associated rhomboid family serine protease